MRERPRLRALAALLASLALNALAAWALARAGSFAPPPARRTEVALAPVSPEAWRANRSVRPDTPPAPSPPPPERGRVVEQPPERRASDRPPDASRYLSDRNVRTERETVSRDAGRSPRLAPRREPGAAVQPPPRVAGRSVPSPAAARPPRRSPGERGPGDALRDGLAVAPSPERERATGEGTRRGAEAPPEPPEPGAGPGRRARPSPDLRPSAESLARIAGGPNMDGYREAEEGDETLLSSREFRFATFLNQMRNAIAEFWYPGVEKAIRERDPEGRDVFFRERTVVLHLTLGPAGELRALRVAESSEVDFVDAVAVSAVRAAQPFANPPRALFGPGGEARVPFAFTVFPFERRGVVRWRPPVGR